MYITNNGKDKLLLLCESETIYDERKTLKDSRD